jgi:hypothetical protein
MQMSEFSKKDVQFLFGKLDEYAEMESEELNSIINNELENLEKINYLLEGSELSEKIIDVNHIKNLRRKKRELSRCFGNIILTSSDLFSSGKTRSALDLLGKFLNDCKSPFYKKQAENRINYFLKKSE